MKSILVIHGPNLDLLGTRQPELYGTLTLDQLNAEIHGEAARLGNVAVIHQGNSELSLISFLEAHARRASGIVINPGILSHYATQLATALRLTGLPAVEVHLSNIHSREMFRRQSVITAACNGRICGLGHYGYLAALRYLSSSAR